MARAYFDESVDIAVMLGVDPRKPGQMIRGKKNTFLYFLNN